MSEEVLADAVEEVAVEEVAEPGQSPDPALQLQFQVLPLLQ